MKKTIKLNVLLGLLLMAAQVFAVEDGLGTNHVRTLKAYDGIVLNNVKIASWTDVAGYTLTNNSITTSMIQDSAVTTGKIAAAVAGAGLTGGGASPLAVGQGDGLTVTADAVAVNASVVRTNGAQTLGGVKTFVDSPIVPTPTTDYQAATKLYIDTKVSGTLATGTVANETLRWTGTVWTNNGLFKVDAAGNANAAGTLTASGVVTAASTTASNDKDTGALVVEGGVGVEGNLNAGGDIGVTGGLRVGGATALGNDIATDTVAMTARVAVAGAMVTVPSGTLDIAAGTGITSVHIQRSYLLVRGSSAPVDITASPQIAAGAAGQSLTLQGMSDVNWLKLDDGNGLALAGGISFTLKNGHLIQFIYDGSVWRELFRTVPAP